MQRQVKKTAKDKILVAIFFFGLKSSLNMSFNKKPVFSSEVVIKDIVVKQFSTIQP